MNYSRWMVSLLTGFTILGLVFNPARAASRPVYVIAFIPVNWSGSQPDFENKARMHGNFFVQQSGLDNYAQVEFRFLTSGLQGVSLDDPLLVEAIVAYGLINIPADRYIGITNGDLSLRGNNAVVGWTLGPDSLGSIVETPLYKLLLMSLVTLIPCVMNIITRPGRIRIQFGAAQIRTRITAPRMTMKCVQALRQIMAATPLWVRPGCPENMLSTNRVITICSKSLAVNLMARIPIQLLQHPYHDPALLHLYQHLHQYHLSWLSLILI